MTVQNIQIVNVTKAFLKEILTGQIYLLMSNFRRVFDGPWMPLKKLSRLEMMEVKKLYSENQSMKSLSKQFQVSNEAIRRIIKSKWVPSKERANEMDLRRQEQNSNRFITPKITKEQKKQTFHDRIRMLFN